MAETLSVTPTETQKLTNMSVDGFKQAMNTKEVQILRNPNTNKLFATDGNGNNFRVEQNIDLTKSISVIVPVDDDGQHLLKEACFINTRNSAAVLATL